MQFFLLRREVQFLLLQNVLPDVVLRVPLQVHHALDESENHLLIKVRHNHPAENVGDLLDLNDFVLLAVFSDLVDVEFEDEGEVDPFDQIGTVAIDYNLFEMFEQNYSLDFLDAQSVLFDHEEYKFQGLYMQIHKI